MDHISEQECQFLPDNFKEDLNKIATYRDKNERLAFKRKRDKLAEMVIRVNMIEDEILAIINERKIPIIEEIQELRNLMIKECVHPRDMLQHKGNYIECKFCNAKLSLGKLSE